jgi:predicted ArsR family transcriptional regulator
MNEVDRVSQLDNPRRNIMLDDILQYIGACGGGVTVEMLSVKFGIRACVMSSLMSYYKHAGYIKVSATLPTGGRPKNVFALSEKGIMKLNKYLNPSQERILG